MKKFFIIDYDYFSVNNLLSSQFGFRSGVSTEHARLKFSDDFQKLFDQKLQLQHSLISVKCLTVWIIIFYYLNSNDIASMKLHCNGLVVTYQTVNNIVNSSNILSFVLFADDTTVYVQHDSIDGTIQILNSELAKVAEWFD